MPNYRRLFVPGGTYFLTLVADGRRPILTSPAARSLLRGALEQVRAERPVEIVAVVLLPDHLHTVWALPPEDADYPERIRRVKELFTRRFLTAGGPEGDRSPSRARQGERAVWQRRYWEHHCRDPDDLDRCLDYIHWNPVKHGLAARPRDYPWSTFHRFVQAGVYHPDWGAAEVRDVWGAEWD